MADFAPTHEDAVAETVANATGPLAVVGGGTRHLPGTGDTLTLAKLSGISLYEPGALTVVAAAGTPVADIESALLAEGQMLPFEPMDHRALLGRSGTPTIGGAVAMNVSGPRRVYAGACRDSLIGVRFVDGRGDIVKSGGRVMKNVTGYDLVKLLAGSRGTLGVLTEVSFKVLPKPETFSTLRIDGLDTPTAIAVLSTALSSPYQVTGAAFVPEGLGESSATLLRLEGFETSVAERAAALSQGLSPFGVARINTVPEVEDVWSWVRDANAFAASDHDIWRISVRASVAAEVADRLSDAKLMFDWGGGLVWAGVEAGRDVRALLAGVPGHATLVRASDETFQSLRALAPEVAPLAALATGLRSQFDPRRILNPGAME